jgi:hypothetical protein
VEENASQQKWYGFTVMFIYVFICLDGWLQTLSGEAASHPLGRVLIQKLWQIPVLARPLYGHLLIIGLIALVSWGAKGRKELAFHPWKQVVLPAAIGLALLMGSLLFLTHSTGITRTVGYGLTCLLGAVLLQVGLSNLTKYIPNRLKQDIWNVEEESFEQNRTLIQSRELFNIPMQFYHRRKVHDGWININPFRGIMVLGTPGSGKSESVIVPFIKQFLGKGYAMLVYDFKYPTLARIAWHHYRMHHGPGGSLAGHKFHIINLDDISYSHRINPLHARYIRSLADAGETAEAIVTALKKGEKGGGGGSDQFFTQSAINFLSSAIYFLARHEQGKYSTLPHLLAFIAQPYEKIFKCLFSMIELHSLLSPFYSAFQKGAFDQLEGQIGTLRINISRLATKETFWVFTGDDFDLKISNPPSVLVLANSPNSQNVNSAFFSAILLRIIRLVNEPGNHPCALVVDELPTLYLHKLDNLIATARSNKVAVVLGLQEVTQLQQLQGKETAATITSIMGSILSGAVRSKETLDWLERMFGKVKQVSQGVSIDRTRTGLNMNEKMDMLIPASKIANQNTGEIVGVVARENQDKYGPYQSNTFRCKVKLDLKQIDEEKSQYRDVPKIYEFGTEEERQHRLMEHLQQVYRDVEGMVGEEETSG